MRAKNSTSELGRTRLKPRSSAMLGDHLDQRLLDLVQAPPRRRCPARAGAPAPASGPRRPRCSNLRRFSAKASGVSSERCLANGLVGFVQPLLLLADLLLIGLAPGLDLVADAARRGGIAQDPLIVDHRGDGGRQLLRARPCRSARAQPGRPPAARRSGAPRSDRRSGHTACSSSAQKRVPKLIRKSSVSSSLSLRKACDKSIAIGPSGDSQDRPPPAEARMLAAVLDARAVDVDVGQRAGLDEHPAEDPQLLRQTQRESAAPPSRYRADCRPAHRRSRCRAARRRRT